MNDSPIPDMVTIVIRHQVRSGAQADYEQWLKRIIPAAERFPGHRGVNVITPSEGAGGYTVTLRFDTLEQAQHWLASSTRSELTRELASLLERSEEIDTVTGMEFWFTPPSATRRAKPYKQFLLTLSVIYPLTLVLPWMLAPLVDRVPALQHTVTDKLLVAALIVGLMTYVVMPRYTRLVHKWLFR
jgi:antibiotic biosynthesis monooxygenase (ABM) superfamily enzyme